MIDLAMEKTDVKMHKDFLKFWKDKDVFAYIKSQDNRWLYENDEKLKVNHITVINTVNILGYH